MTSYAEKPFAAFRVGDHAELTRVFTQQDVELFALLSGDHHPAHLDEAYARGTRFGVRVVHGMLTASLLSAANALLLGTRFGVRVVHGMLTASLLSAANALLLGTPGAISVEQTLRFLRPVVVGDAITARSEVVAILLEQRRLRCRTTCVNQRGELVLAGEALEQKD